MSLANLEFELPRRVVLLQSTTTMPNGEPLGFIGDPNNTNPSAGSATGDFLLNNAPVMTMFIDTASDLLWRRTMVGSWELMGGSGGGSTVHQYFTYDPVIDQLVATRPITTTLNSFYLGQQHKMSSGGENIFFTNLSTGINWYSMWGGIKDQSKKENQGPSGLIAPSGRVYSPFLESIARGRAPAVSGSVPYHGVTTIPFNGSIFATEFTVAEEVLEDDFLYNRAYIGEGLDRILIYEQILTGVGISEGDTYKWTLDHPLEGHRGSTLTVLMAIAKGFKDANTTLLQVRPTEHDPTSYFERSYYRTFEDKDLSFKDDIVSMDYAEREAERAFTLHDMFSGGLTAQDGTYLSFNHADSHAFQEATSTDWAWASHYIDPVTSSGINTVHTHGNDSMLSLMDGDCLSFASSDSLVASDFTATRVGNLAVSWNEPNSTYIAGSRMPTIVLDLPRYGLSETAHVTVTVLVPASRAIIYHYSSEDLGILPAPAYTFNVDHHLMDYSGATSPDLMDLPPMEVIIRFKTAAGKQTTDILPFQMGTPNLPTPIGNVGLNVDGTLNARWQSVNALEAIVGNTLPNMEVRIPAFTTDQETKMRLVIRDSDTNAIRYTKDTHALGTVYAGNTWVSIGQNQMVTSSADLQNLPVDIEVAFTTAMGNTEVFTDNRITMSNSPPSDGNRRLMTTRTSGTTQRVGTMYFDVYRKDIIISDEKRGTIWTNDFGLFVFYADDVQVRIRHPDISSFTLILTPFNTDITDTAQTPPTLSNVANTLRVSLYNHNNNYLTAINGVSVYNRATFQFKRDWEGGWTWEYNYS